VRTVWTVAVKELRQIRRDRRSVLILLFIPAFFLFLYGYALNFDIRNIALAVEDRDQTADSRALISAFVHSGYFDAVATTRGPDAARQALLRDEARALLVIPSGFSERRISGEVAEVQILINGDNANTATTVLGYANALVGDAAARIDPAAGGPLVSVAPRVWYNPELRSTLFLVPGLIAYIAMITAVVSTALSIVREKENGTMEQVRMAPIGTPAFVLGKVLPYLILSQLSALLVIVAAMALFGMPMRGDWLSLSALVALFLVGALGTGLLVSTVAETQQTAFQAGLLIAFLPTFILSGFIFPIASMPLALQYVTMTVPARYFLVALRGVVLKGLGLADFWPQIVALTIYAAVVLGLSALRLSRR
jgi:ABC-2 type transport system permease protein